MIIKFVKISLILALFMILNVCVIFSQTLEDKGNKKQNTQAWTKIKLKKLSFNIPKNFKSIDFKGTDSRFWTYESENSILNIEVGRYAKFNPYYKTKIDYKEKEVLINNKKAKICSYKLDKPLDKKYTHIANVYFEKNHGSSVNTVFSVFYKNKEDKEIAVKIFNSIKFR